ncbi:unnamed protein product [Urochloa humidicola]
MASTVALLVVSLLVASAMSGGGIGAQAQPLVPAVISFGDSTIDVGNNNYPPRGGVQGRLPAVRAELRAPPSHRPVLRRQDRHRRHRQHHLRVQGAAGTDMGVGKEGYRAMSAKLQRVLDIAFFRGKLYTLSTHGELLAIEIGAARAPVATP